MSDMSRPGPRPSAAPDHERHDALLVAQYVAGDPLEPERQAEAQRLVASCAACAALAADLPAVSRAVAQEPVPRRRRDFRLSPEQAEELRGSVLTRWLRRLSLPSSRAFQPAAAGVLSIGLLFVVAGYAWPDGGTVVVQAEPNYIDWSSTAPAALPVEEAVDDAGEGLADESAPEPAAPRAVEPDGDMADVPAVANDGLTGAEELMESEFADSLAESQAGLSEGLAEKSVVDGQDARSAGGATEPPALEAMGRERADDALMQALDEEAATMTSRSSAADDALIAEGAQQDAGDAAAPAGVIEVPADDDRLEELLIVLGLVLALSGGGLLLLGWLARRARDPLAP